MNNSARGLILGLALGCLLLSGCVAAREKSAPAAQPDSYWLSSPQTEPSEDILRAVAGIHGNDDYNLVHNAMLYVAENLAFDPYLNREQFNRSAAGLFSEGTLGGCSDFALAELALFRALGFPARLTLSANLKWIERYRHNNLATPNGHSFVEVLIKGRWHLVDPTYFALYSGYDPENPYLPGSEIFMARGRDFAELGVTSVDTANQILTAAAKAYQGGYKDPQLTEVFRLQLDFPRTFTKLAKTLLKSNRTYLAKRLLRKALELDPANSEAAALYKTLP